MNPAAVICTMPTLSERLLEEPRDQTLSWFRQEEIGAEIPVPFCCPRGAGIRVASPNFLVDSYDDAPVWLAKAPSRHFSVEECVVTNCPFCGTHLPRLVRRKDLPHPLYSADETHCDTCHERNIRCRCFPAVSAWEAEDAPPVFAAVCLLTKFVTVPGRVPSMRFLSVSRKGRPSEKGLPGGRIEPGESPEAAARRELLEETGFIAGPMHKVFDAVDDAKVRVVAFRAQTFSETSGSRPSSETGIVEWVSMTDLVASSPFASFNQSLFSLLGIRC
jgi:ADP-ribose pyrophosphatase YjhB (NUDIX family)